ncbi:MAG: FHA domain-containing protein [Acaryochloridaceae cyanobacterium CSU_3_4]|nr:FHA domain-containing protein [Acaryochloridaceae cyanobacterium CSU_3_4]
MSRRHARLIRVPESSLSKGCYRILDGDANGKRSANGIAVNEQPGTSHYLSSGDQIMIGKVQASYYIEHDVPANQADPSPKVELQKIDDLSPPINPKATLCEQPFPEDLILPTPQVNAEDEAEDDLPATMLFRKS